MTFRQKPNTSSQQWRDNRELTQVNFASETTDTDLHNNYLETEGVGNIRENYSMFVDNLPGHQNNFELCPVILRRALPGGHEIGAGTVFIQRKLLQPPVQSPGQSAPRLIS